ncbi:MAG TPA: hypothetical protein VMM78_08730 [Thermomicrobiales bacterium]|nr:hypothetical protein [Thermomicrobiales bacterium]
MNRDEIVRRWRASADATGVRLTDEDLARIESRGGLDRVLAIENILDRVAARVDVPDYLATLTGGAVSE